MSDLQNNPVVFKSPIEIERACSDLRDLLIKLSWIDKPMFIAERFFRKNEKGLFIYPETYAPKDSGRRDYARLTPDNDSTGMFFFIVGDGLNDEFQASQYNFIKWPVGIIFSVNLELIDSSQLDSGLFTQTLLAEARRCLTDGMISVDFDYQITSETRDLQRAFREFRLDELESYNRAPMQCFRLDLLVRVREECK